MAAVRNVRTRTLEADLARAGFASRPGKGSHRNWTGPRGVEHLTTNHNRKDADAGTVTDARKALLRVQLRDVGTASGLTVGTQLLDYFVALAADEGHKASAYAARLGLPMASASAMLRSLASKGLAERRGGAPGEAGKWYRSAGTVAEDILRAMPHATVPAVLPVPAPVMALEEAEAVQTPTETPAAPVAPVSPLDVYTARLEAWDAEYIQAAQDISDAEELLQAARAEYASLDAKLTKGKAAMAALAEAFEGI